MNETLELLALFERFTPEQRKKTQKQFEALAREYLHTGYTDLWLTAIADVRDGRSPWLEGKEDEADHKARKYDLTREWRNMIWGSRLGMYSVMWIQVRWPIPAGWQI